MVKCSGDGDISEYRNVDDNDYCDEDDGIHDDDKDEVDDSNDYVQVAKVRALVFLLNNDIADINHYNYDYDYDNNDQVGKVTALAFLLNGSETELFLCEEGAVKITLGRFCRLFIIIMISDCHHQQGRCR